MFSENHIRVAAAIAVLWRRDAACTKSQCLRESGLLAQVWRDGRSISCCDSYQYQLLFLEEDTQVRSMKCDFLQLLICCRTYSKKYAFCYLQVGVQVLQADGKL